jgi:hypothetical protein
VKSTVTTKKNQKKSPLPSDFVFPEIRFKIKGVNWSARLLPEAEYERVHGDDSRAICIFTEYCIDVNDQHCDYGTISHELGHAYIDSCLVSREHLDQDEFEELFCEIIGEHSLDIVRQTRRILRYFTKKVST